MSGRSRWLEDRRTNADWTSLAFLGPHPETALIGLERRVQEELGLASAVRQWGGRKGADVMSLMEGLLHRELQALSGGELVRVVVASALTRCAQEVQIDVALEQLDRFWRKEVLSLLLRPARAAADTILISDNRFTAGELEQFAEIVRFPHGDASPGQLNTPLSEEWPPETFPFDCSGIDPVSINIQGLSFSYPGAKLPVFKDLCLELEPGRLYLLSGPNGSGKTTFVKLLSGTLLPQSGTILYENQVFMPHRSRARYTATAFQNPDYQWSALTVQAELDRLAAKPAGGSLQNEQLLWSFGLPASCLQENPLELPFVLKKRLGLALSAASGKPWLVLDEPTLGQDAVFCTHLAQLMTSLLAAGIGVILISHHDEFKAAFSSAASLVVSEQGIRVISGGEGGRDSSR
jgi:energy-coupling factor transporter ATP-binding protein EcfA2